MLFRGPDKPQNCPFLLGDLDPIEHMVRFLGTTRVYLLISIWISSVVFVGLTNVTNRQTDRRTTLLLL